MTLWTIGHEAPLSMGFSRQEYWSGLSFLHHKLHVLTCIPNWEEIEDIAKLAINELFRINMLLFTMKATCYKSW